MRKTMGSGPLGGSGCNAALASRGKKDATYAIGRGSSQKAPGRGWCVGGKKEGGGGGRGGGGTRGRGGGGALDLKFLPRKNASKDLRKGIRVKGVT